MPKKPANKPAGKSLKKSPIKKLQKGSPATSKVKDPEMN